MVLIPRIIGSVSGAYLGAQLLAGCRAALCDARQPSSGPRMKRARRAVQCHEAPISTGNSEARSATPRSRGGSYSGVSTDSDVVWNTVTCVRCTWGMHCVRGDGACDTGGCRSS